MARCEDFPCCGHEIGCCPDFDEAGRQLNMVCTCGAKLPINNRSSLCERCLIDPDDPDSEEYEHDGQPDEAQEWHDFDPDC